MECTTIAYLAPIAGFILGLLISDSRYNRVVVQLNDRISRLEATLLNLGSEVLNKRSHPQ